MPTHIAQACSNIVTIRKLVQSGQEVAWKGWRRSAVPRWRKKNKKSRKQHFMKKKAMVIVYDTQHFSKPNVMQLLFRSTLISLAIYYRANMCWFKLLIKDTAQALLSLSCFAMLVHRGCTLRCDTERYVFYGAFWASCQRLTLNCPLVSEPRFPIGTAPFLFWRPLPPLGPACWSEADAAFTELSL